MITPVNVFFFILLIFRWYLLICNLARILSREIVISIVITLKSCEALDIILIMELKNYSKTVRVKIPNLI